MRLRNLARGRRTGVPCSEIPDDLDPTSHRCDQPAKGAQRAGCASTSVAVLLHPDDEVAVAKVSLLPGTQLILNDGSVLRVSQMVPMGHKVALVDVPYDGVVHKYGQIIGLPPRRSKPVNTSTLRTLASRSWSSTTLFPRTTSRSNSFPNPNGEPSWDTGGRRPGRHAQLCGGAGFGELLVIRHRAIAEYFANRACWTSSRMSMESSRCRTRAVAGRTSARGISISSSARWPVSCTTRTSAGYVILSLGCEVNQPTDMIEATPMRDDAPLVLTIQQDGGFLKTVEAGIEAVKKILPGQQSDPGGSSCVGAGGRAAMRRFGRMVGRDRQSWPRARQRTSSSKQGGTVVLGETTEVYGAEHLLTRRAKTPEVGQKLID